MNEATTARIAALVERGAIVNDSYPIAPAVGRYQGNGRFGGVYSRLGLHVHPSEQGEWDQHGKTQWMHMRHWGRFHYHSSRIGADTSADFLLPVARIYWDRLPADVSAYQQRQSFYDGTLHTAFTADGVAASVESWFDPVNRDLCGFSFIAGGALPDVILAPAARFTPYFYTCPGPAHQRYSVRRRGDCWVVDITCSDTVPTLAARLYVHGDMPIEPCDAGLRIRLQPGAGQLLVSYGQPISREDIALSRQRSREHHRQTWHKAAWFDFPDERAQQMWVRSMAYVMSTFNDDGIGFAPTNGFTGNTFPFNYAQDLFYVHPLLLASGQLGTAKAWIESFSARIEGMRSYARHLWPEVDGIYPPWELPHGPIEGFHAPSVPVVYCYEPHNAGYLARMAHDTSLALDDPAWTRAHVTPLLREVAAYYRSFCRREDDGLWHLDLQPSVGQDEAGGRNQKDYLCALFSARYSFQIAVQHGLDVEGHYQRILDDGLAFASLLSPSGFYYASAGAGEGDFGQQKHPVQLNGLAYLPVEPQPTAPDIAAHRMRYQTTKLASQPHFFGWTLGEFLLASAHLDDADGWRHDWAQLRPSEYTDPDWVQLRETSAALDQAFYITTHGLVAQSLYGSVIHDYWGSLQVQTQLPLGGEVRFGAFRSRLGVLVAGVAGNGEAQIQLSAWKDCSLEVNGAPVSLRAGEVAELRFMRGNVMPVAKNRN